MYLSHFLSNPAQAEQVLHVRPEDTTTMIRGVRPNLQGELLDLMRGAGVRSWGRPLPPKAYLLSRFVRYSMNYELASGYDDTIIAVLASTLAKQSKYICASYIMALTHASTLMIYFRIHQLEFYQFGYFSNSLCQQTFYHGSHRSVVQAFDHAFLDLMSMWGTQY